MSSTTRVAPGRDRRPAGPVDKAMAGTGRYLDDRTGLGPFTRGMMNKVFPDHWSFMLGEIALYSFVILLLSGTYLTFFYKPAMTEVVYNGVYAPLRGVNMSIAYASSIDTSFDVRGGLLMRQVHHWAALLFVSSMAVHAMRTFFTGAFRKPREFNWHIGIGLLILGLAEGFAGYSLPDDLLSGTGLRIAQAIMLSIPLVGTYVSMLIFGGEFPGDDFISRLYGIHILLIPAVLLALIGAHLFLVVLQKHNQWPGPGHTNGNVVGYKLFPIYAGKAGGFFFVVFGMMALLGGFAQINPVWMFGPYQPAQITAGSQPDWYIGFLDGALRLMPNWETNIWGHTIMWNIMIPALGIGAFVFLAMAVYPAIEQWVTKDKREHHVLDRPRNVPTRTAIGVMAITFYIVLWIAGGNDIIAAKFSLSINAIIWTLRISVFLLPAIAFVVTKRICLGLQRKDRDKLLHGRESGIIRRLPNGYTEEIHEPIDRFERAFLLDREDVIPASLDDGQRPSALRARVSEFYYGDRVPKPTDAELEEAEHHMHQLPEAEAEERRELSGSSD